MLFERAMLRDPLDLQRNPIEPIKLRGTSRRLRRPHIITPEKFRWEHIDLSAGVILVQQGVVSGRIGKVKTEAANDEIPLDLAVGCQRLT